jgi:hypothetical protein
LIGPDGTSQRRLQGAVSPAFVQVTSMRARDAARSSDALESRSIRRRSLSSSSCDKLARTNHAAERAPASERIAAIDEIARKRSADPAAQALAQLEHGCATAGRRRLRHERGEERFDGRFAQGHTSGPERRAER